MVFMKMKGFKYPFNMELYIKKIRRRNYWMSTLFSGYKLLDEHLNTKPLHFQHYGRNCLIFIQNINLCLRYFS